MSVNCETSIVGDDVRSPSYQIRSSNSKPDELQVLRFSFSGACGTFSLGCAEMTRQLPGRTIEFVHRLRRIGQRQTGPFIFLRAYLRNGLNDSSRATRLQAQILTGVHADQNLLASVATILKYAIRV